MKFITNLSALVLSLSLSSQTLFGELEKSIKYNPFSLFNTPSCIPIGLELKSNKVSLELEYSFGANILFTKPNEPVKYQSFNYNRFQLIPRFYLTKHFFFHTSLMFERENQVDAISEYIDRNNNLITYFDGRFTFHGARITGGIGFRIKIFNEKLFIENQLGIGKRTNVYRVNSVITNEIFL